MWLFDEVAERMTSGLTLGAGVSTLTLGGVHLHDWVYILTIVLLVTQLTKVLLNSIVRVWRKLWKK